MALPTFKASARLIRMSPRKLRLVADLVRGKDYNTALAILRVAPQRGAGVCIKTLKSAYANAGELIRQKPELKDIDVETLRVTEARVDGGPILWRVRPSSQRRPQWIRKRTSHLHLALTPEAVPAPAPKPKAAPAAPEKGKKEEKKAEKKTARAEKKTERKQATKRKEKK